MMILRRNIKSLVVRQKAQQFEFEGTTLSVDSSLSQLFGTSEVVISLRNNNNQHIALSNRIQSFIGEQLFVYQNNLKVSRLSVLKQKPQSKHQWLQPLLQLHAIPAFMRSPISKLIDNVDKQQSSGKSLSESIWKSVHSTASRQPQFDDQAFILKLRDLQKDYNQLQRRAVLVVNNKLMGLLVLNNLLLGFIYYGTFHLYSWDVMEPIAYFLTASVGVLSLRRFSKIKKEVTLENWIEYERREALKKLMIDTKFNEEELIALRKLKQRAGIVKLRNQLWFL